MIRESVLFQRATAQGLHAGSVRTQEMANRSLNVVREGLQAYADRGVFRGFSEAKAGRGEHTFTFEWLSRRPLSFTVDTEKGVLKFKNILPGVPLKSALYSELKQFVNERHDGALPEHRRIDRRRAEVTCSNRGGAVSIALRVKKNQYAYGVNKIVNLAHEIFVHLKDHYADYLWESFDAPQE